MQSQSYIHVCHFLAVTHSHCCESNRAVSNSTSTQKCFYCAEQLAAAATAVGCVSVVSAPSHVCTCAHQICQLHEQLLLCHACACLACAYLRQVIDQADVVIIDLGCTRLHDCCQLPLQLLHLCCSAFCLSNTAATGHFRTRRSMAGKKSKRNNASFTFAVFCRRRLQANNSIENTAYIRCHDTKCRTSLDSLDPCTSSARPGLGILYRNSKP